jgi:hypothetical protein
VRSNNKVDPDNKELFKNVNPIKNNAALDDGW